MAKRFTGIGVIVVLAAIGGLGALGACNSSTDDTADCSTLPSCCAQLTSATNKSECDAVVSAGNAANCAAAQTEFAQAMYCTVTTGGGGGSTGCAGLTACCSTLSAGDQSACAEEVSLSGGVDSTCSTFLTEYQDEGMCAAATGTGTGTGGGTGCAGLSACCATVPAADQSSCETLVADANDTACTEELTVFMESGYCGATTGTGTGTGTGGGTNCSALSACCATVPAADQSSCDEVVSAGSDTECSAELTVYTESGYCGAGTGTGTGTGGGTGCASLSACCGTVPAADQSSCDEVVSAGSDTECSDELTVYMESGYCG